MNRSVYYQKLDKSRLPYHVAVIMDGNGMAYERNLPRAVGHRTGMESLRTVKLCSQLGIKILTVYAFF